MSEVTQLTNIMPNYSKLATDEHSDAHENYVSVVEAMAVKVGCTSGILSIILEVIEEPSQEGGWKLTSNSNDPDGGWTFAGVTSNTLTNYLHEHEVSFEHIDSSTILAMLKSDVSNGVPEIWRERVLKCYYQYFYLPACKIVANLLNEPDMQLEGYELSCVVNLGLPHFEQVANDCYEPAEHNEKAGDFIHHWMVFYINLVVKNAEAWQKFALQEADHNKEVKPRNCPEPTTLRADNLLGWYNRVEHWRTTE